VAHGVNAVADATGVRKIASAATQSLKSSRRAFPGAPLIAGLKDSLQHGSPSDATCLERLRDDILLGMSKLDPLFMFLAFCGTVGVLGFGIFIVLLFLALMFGVSLGEWTRVHDGLCYNLTETPELADSGSSFPPMGVPLLNGHWVSTHCIPAQFYFMICVKFFTGFFGYLQICPLVWRLSILAHAFGGGRSSEDGLDFYGRRTNVIWFHIPRRKRAQVAVANTVASFANIGGIAAHGVYWHYSQWMVMPSVGAFLTLGMMAFGIIPGIIGGVKQSKAEAKLCREHPHKFPPSVSTELKERIAMWRKGEIPGSFCTLLYDFFQDNYESFTLAAVADTTFASQPLAENPELAQRLAASVHCRGERRLSDDMRAGAGVCDA